MRKLVALIALVPSAILSVAACVGDDPASGGNTPNPNNEGGAGSSGSPVGSALAIAPVTLTFPITPPAGTSATSTVVVTNKGTAPSNPLEHAAITGPQATSFTVAADDCQAKALGIAESCSIGIAFKPQAEGAHAATLTLGSMNVTLSGTSSLFVPEDADHAAQNSLTAVHAIDPTHVYAVGQSGRVITSTDGATWTSVSTPAGSTELRAVYASENGHLYVGGKGPFMMVQPPATTGFATVPLPTTNPMTAIHALWATPPGAQQKEVYALGEGGRWLIFTQGQAPSLTQMAGVTTAVYAVAGNHNPAGGGNQSFCAVGANATTQSYASAAGGDPSPNVMSPAGRTLYSVWTDGANVVAGASDGVILRGTSCGMLAQDASFAGVSFYGLWGKVATDLWIVGSGGAIYRSSTPGSWTKVESGTTKDLHAIHGTASSNLYVVGDGVILHKKQ
jgi:hypothetical protein